MGIFSRKSALEKENRTIFGLVNGIRQGLMNLTGEREIDSETIRELKELIKRAVVNLNTLEDKATNEKDKVLYSKAKLVINYFKLREDTKKEHIHSFISFIDNFIENPNNDLIL